MNRNVKDSYISQNVFKTSFNLIFSKDLIVKFEKSSQKGGCKKDSILVDTYKEQYEYHKSLLSA